MLDGINPLFLRWLGEQAEEVRADVMAKWSELNAAGSQPGIYTGKNSNHARRRDLIIWASKHGFYAE